MQPKSHTHIRTHILPHQTRTHTPTSPPKRTHTYLPTKNAHTHTSPPKTHTHIRTHILPHQHAHTCAHTHTCTHTHMYTHVHTQNFPHPHPHIYTIHHTHTHVRAHTHTHTHTNKHTHTHKHVPTQATTATRVCLRTAVPCERALRIVHRCCKSNKLLVWLGSLGREEAGGVGSKART